MTPGMWSGPVHGRVPSRGKSDSRILKIMQKNAPVSQGVFN